MPDLVEMRRAAEEAAHRSGELLRHRFIHPQRITVKGYRDWVTNSDIASQESISTVILDYFPDHGFLSEEENELPAEGSVLWIIDPLDGTSNYSRQQPNFTVSIAAAVEIGSANKPQSSCIFSPRLVLVLGIIYDPFRDELYSAAAGQGCTLNGQVIRVSSVAELRSSIVALDWSRQNQNRQSLVDSLNRWAHRVHTIRALGSAALALAWLAAGRLDIYFNIGAKPWDVAAGKIIVSEARGQVSDATGGEWTLDSPECLASNGLLHEDFLRYVNSQSK